MPQAKSSRATRYAEQGHPVASLKSKNNNDERIRVATNDDIKACLGPEVAKYAANKHRGGSSGNRGTRYEDFFMAYRVAQAVAAIVNDPAHKDPTVKGQCGGLVDDLRIATPDSTKYFQLKNQEKVGWTAGDHPIATDFRYQKVLSDHLKEPSPSTTLVVACATLAAALGTNIPASISGHTAVEHFPWHPTPNSLVFQFPDLQAHLALLSHTEAPTLDVLSAVFGMLLIACLNHPDGASAREIAETAAKQRPGQLRPLPVTEDWESYLAVDFRQALAAIHGLVYSAKRGFFHWSGFGTSGVFGSSVLSEEFKQFQNDIVQRQPKTFEEFEEVLP